MGHTRWPNLALVTGSTGTPGRPLRVAVVGSGPAGFYAAGQLLSTPGLTVEVDLFDRLPTPWGLVRFGVAPDHPKIKSVTRVFEKTARMPGFRFHGNVEVGVDVSHEQLAAAYDAVLYAVGTATDRKLGIEGEDLPGSHAATEFVAWYNGHPDYANFNFDLDTKRVVVVGAGNVALDVARMLALSAQELAGTDTADHALQALRDSAVEEIIVLSRRGPAQASFTNPELRELADLELADVIVSSRDVELDEASAAELAQADGTTKRNVETLAGYAALSPQGRPRRVELRFLASPIAIEGNGHVQAIVVERNVLVRGPDGSLRAKGTGELERIETGLVFRSIGYLGVPLPGVPFDPARSTMLNQDGRVIDPDTSEPLPGVYAAGWIKRGPSGVIGTNKKCANETVALLLADHAADRLATPSATPDALLAELRSRGVKVVDYSGWEAIDAHERALGEPSGRPRVKLVHRHEMLTRAGH
jgi:ferredoxin/flavodoxin---NADP+ reductase